MLASFCPERQVSWVLMVLLFPSLHPRWSVQHLETLLPPFPGNVKRNVIRVTTATCCLLRMFS